MPSPEDKRQRAPRKGVNPIALVIAIVAFVTSVIGAFVLSTKMIGIAIVVTLAMTLVLFACLFAMRGDDRYRVVRHSGDIDFDAMSSMLGAGSFLHKFEMSAPLGSDVRMAGYVSNPTVDRLFVTSPYHVEVIGRYELPDMMIPYERYLSADLDGDAATVRHDNGDDVVGLAGDLTTTMLATGKNIPVTLADVQDVTVTDYAFDRVVATTGINGTILFDGCSMSIADGGFLLPTSQSGNVNEITAHSVLITADGYMAFMEGTANDPVHEGRVVPSVSCSLHAGDIAATASFQDAIVFALHKATRREYDLDESCQIGSSMLGLARIVERNGATEFYAITRTDRTIGQLIAGHDNTYSVPVRDLMRPWLAGAQNDNQMAELLARVAYTLLDSSSVSMSVSMAGLVSALFEGMGNAKVKGTVMRRLGYGGDAPAAASDPTNDIKDIVNQAMSNPGGTGNLGNTGAVQLAQRITFGGTGVIGNANGTGNIGNAGTTRNMGATGNMGVAGSTGTIGKDNPNA